LRDFMKSKGVLFMLQRTVSYKTLLRIVGACFLLYGLYIIVVVLTSRMSARGDIVYDGPWVFEDPGAVMGSGSHEADGPFQIIAVKKEIQAGSMHERRFRE